MYKSCWNLKPFVIFRVSDTASVSRDKIARYEDTSSKLFKAYLFSVSLFLSGPLLCSSSFPQYFVVFFGLQLRIFCAYYVSTDIYENILASGL